MLTHKRPIVGRLKEDLYRTIIQSVPVLCVDLLIRRNNRYLLVKRKNEPLAGEWWVPGGRVHRNESLVEAAARLAQEEVGITGGTFEMVGFFEDVFEKSAIDPERGIHTVSAVFRIDDPIGKPKVDFQSSEFSWSSTIPTKFLKNYNRL